MQSLVCYHAWTNFWGRSVILMGSYAGQLSSAILSSTRRVWGLVRPHYQVELQQLLEQLEGPALW